MTIKIVAAFMVSILVGLAMACGETAPEPTPTRPPAIVEPTTSPTSTPEPEVVEIFDVGPCRMTRAAQLPIEFEYKGTIPTGFEGINKAT